MLAAILLLRVGTSFVRSGHVGGWDAEWVRGRTPRWTRERTKESERARVFLVALVALCRAGTEIMVRPIMGTYWKSY